MQLIIIFISFMIDLMVFGISNVLNSSDYVELLYMCSSCLFCIGLFSSFFDIASWYTCILPSLTFDVPVKDSARFVFWFGFSGLPLQN